MTGGNTAEPDQIRHAKVAALKVQLALSAYHLIEGDRTLPFAKGMCPAMHCMASNSKVSDNARSQ